MTNAMIRQQLHQMIDVADDKKIEALYDFFQKDMAPDKYTQEELGKFYGRLEQYENGEMPSFSLQEAHAYIRQNKSVK